MIDTLPNGKTVDRAKFELENSRGEVELSDGNQFLGVYALGVLVAVLGTYLGYGMVPVSSVTLSMIWVHILPRNGCRSRGFLWSPGCTHVKGVFAYRHHTQNWHLALRRQSAL